MVGICAHGREVDVEGMAEEVNFSHFLGREVNAGLSGGEIKRSELLQLMAQNPDLMLFDEPESGVDMENMHLVGATIAHLLQKDKAVYHANGASIADSRRKRTKMGLIITHTGYILDYLEADSGHVLYNGILSCPSNPREILRCVAQNGYQECVRCVVPPASTCCRNCPLSARISKEQQAWPIKTSCSNGPWRPARKPPPSGRIWI